MKSKLLLLASLALILASCAKTDDAAVQTSHAASQSRTLTLTANVPNNAQPRTTLEQESGTKNIIVRWKAGDVIHLFFKQDDVLKETQNVALTDFSNNDKTAKFAVNVPEGINADQPYTLYGVHGTTAAITDGKVLADVSPKFSARLADMSLPMMFTADISGSVIPAVQFNHLGVLQIITLKNSDAQPLQIFGVAPVSTADNTTNWIYANTTTNAPYYNLLTNTVETKAQAMAMPSAFTMTAGQIMKLSMWGMPNGASVPEIKLYVIKSNLTDISSVNTKPARTLLEKGKAYHLYADWNGTQLNIIDTEPVTNITFTTTKAVGAPLRLYIDAATEDRPDVWIDLNNNGIKDGQEANINFGAYVNYTLGAQSVTIYGKVTILACDNNQLTALDVTNNATLNKLFCENNQLKTLNVTKNTALTDLGCNNIGINILDVSKNTELQSLHCGKNQLTALDVTNNIKLRELSCRYNQIRGEAMTDLVNSLVDRSATSQGNFMAYGDNNVLTAAQGTIVTGKNWKVIP